MPWSALPDKLNPYKNPEAWKGTDDDTWLMRWRIKVKGWFAYGPRATEWWAKWRPRPLAVFAICGGYIRLEDDEFSYTFGRSRVWWFTNPVLYVSRCQKYASWSIQLQWPLFFAAHLGSGDKPWFFYIGAARDADCVYWFPSLYLGRRWK